MVAGCLMGVYLTGLHLIGVHLMGVHLMGYCQMCGKMRDGVLSYLKGILASFIYLQRLLTVCHS
jgi:hypothetical protein